MTNYNDFALTTNPEVNKNIVENFKHGVDALFAQYGMATVMDICDLIGITSIDSEDSKYGWTKDELTITLRNPSKSLDSYVAEYDDWIQPAHIHLSPDPHLLINETDEHMIIVDSKEGVKRIKHDPVNHPAHYTAGGIECIDAIAAALTSQKDPMAAWLTGQCLKYLWRWPLKNGLEDLKKTRFYLDRLIKYVEET